MDRVPSLVALRYHRDLLLFVIELAIQFYFMKKYQASYSEYYYGIHRESVTSKAFKTGATLFVGAVLPMLKEQLNSIFTQWKLKMRQDPDQLSRFQKAFLAVYPFVNLGWESAMFYYAGRYLLDDHWPYFNFLYHVLGQKVAKRESEADDPDAKSSMIAVFIKKYLIFAIFIGIKFFEWHFDTTRRRNELMKLKENVKIDPPFTKDAALNICPICQKKVSNPCCLNVSGYVFCQSCIYDYIHKASKCPVTNIPANLSNIHRLYV